MFGTTRSIRSTSVHRVLRRAGAAALALSMAGAAGCGKDKKSVTGPAAGTTYTLRTINDSPLPYTIALDLPTGEHVTLRFETGALLFKAGGKYESGGRAVLQTCRGTVCDPEEVSDEPELGSYRVSGSRIIFNPDDEDDTTDDSYDASISGNTIALTFGVDAESYRFVFQK